MPKCGMKPMIIFCYSRIILKFNHEGCFEGANQPILQKFLYIFHLLILDIVSLSQKMTVIKCSNSIFKIFFKNPFLLQERTSECLNNVDFVENIYTDFKINTSASF